MSKIYSFKTFSTFLFAILCITTSCKKQVVKTDLFQSPLITIQKVSTSTNSSTSINLSKGLIAFYPFNGNANDASGNNYNGVVTGATLSSDRFGKKNSAYNFNGLATSNSTVIVRDQFIDVPNFIYNFQNKITISLWALTYPTNYGNFLQRRTNNTIDFAVSNYAGIDGQTPGPNKITCNFGTIGGVTGSTLIAYNTWHNYTYEYDGSSLKLYLDGVLDGQQSASGLISNNTTTMNIGRYIYYGGSTYYFYFNGVMDDIRFYNRVLTQTEITYLAKH